MLKLNEIFSSTLFKKIPPSLPFSKGGTILSFFLILMTFASFAMAQELTARVDRNSITMDETIRLTISVDVNQATDIDLTPLNNDFTVLGTAKSSSLTVVDNVQTAYTQWIITLAPKKTGRLTIPSFVVGQTRTNPLTVRVVEAAAPTKVAGKITGAFLEAEVTPVDPLVQSQVIYTVRLLSLGGSLSGTLNLPEMTNAKIAILGGDSYYQTTRQGQHYDVIERRFVLFPQITGDFQIKPPVFVGQAVAGQSGFTDMAAIFPGHTVRLTAPTLTLHVKPIPSPFNSQTWLSASKLTLNEKWSNPSFKSHIGEPITRIITLEAVGTVSEQLPDFQPPTVSGAKSYKDSTITMSQTSNEGMVGRRVVKMVFIPTESGTIKIPAIKVDWWNTQTNQSITAVLPEHTLQVLSASGASTLNVPAVPTVAKTTIVLPSANPPTAQPHLWLEWIATIGAVIILLIVLFNVRRYWLRKKALSTNGKESAILQKIKVACDSKQLKQLEQALLEWSHLQWPKKPAQSLGELAALLSNEKLKKVIYELDRALYSDEKVTWNGDKFWHVFTKYSPASTDKKSPEEKLPPLY